MRWKSIRGFEGIYLISDTGLVKSCERIIIRKNGKPHPLKEKILRGTHLKGYRAVSLYNFGNIKTVTVHRLVALHFLKPPKNKKRNQINHIDGNILNNQISNLEWVTPKENVHHSIRIGRSKVDGENNPRALLNKRRVAKIRNLFGKKTLQQIADQFGVSNSTIQAIKYKRNWRESNHGDK
jgi:hypothetical protein